MKLLVGNTAMLELDGFTLSQAHEQPISFISQRVIRGNVVLDFFLREVLDSHAANGSFVLQIYGT
jgi:hypothetical protein